MTNNFKTVTDLVIRNFVFTKQFEFRTSVPVDVSADRIYDIPFTEGNANYITEIEPVGNGFLFDIWEGNKYQREPSKARIIGTGTITRRGDETIVQGEVRIGLNRMLMLSVTVLLGLSLYFQAVKKGVRTVFKSAGSPL